MKRAIAAGFMLAAVLGTASATQAQQTQPRQDERAREGAHMRGPRGGGPGGIGFLLKGIELSDNQKSQLQALHEEQRADMPQRGQDDAKWEQARSARERGDTAELRQLRTERQTAMKQQRDRMLADVRGILTQQQKQVFDRNLAAAKQRFEQRDGGRRRDFEHRKETRGTDR